MKFIKGYPPNIEEIKQAGFKVDENSLFCWGEVTYIPSGKEIPIDIEYHEEIHAKQIAQFGSPELWWRKYILDTDFRLAIELEAYSEQYGFIRKTLSAKEAKMGLTELSENLSSPQYNLGLTISQAETLIRKYGQDRI